MRRISLLPNIITAFGLSCGLFVILKVNMIEAGSGAYHLLYTSALLLLLAGVADVFDGALARAFRAESEFGAHFDSLADAVSFGIAPSVLLLKSLALEHGSGISFFAFVGAMLFSLCGILRLVRFNVKTSQAKSDHTLALAQKKHFTGLPIPAGAMAAVSANLLLFSPWIEDNFDISTETRAIALTAVMFVLGYFMVSRWKFPSLKTLHFRLPSFQLVFFLVLFALCVLYGILYFFAIILFAISWGYVVLGWILSIIRLIAGKKSKTLADFEPEPESDDD